MKNEEKMREIAQQVYLENQTRGQFSPLKIPVHTHNGIDNARINEDNLSLGTKVGINLTITDTNTFSLNSIANPAGIIFNGYVGINTVSITFTGSLIAGATSATLNANWTLPTSSYQVTFSNGDKRTVTLTNGSTTATWSSGLSSGATTAATVASYKKAIINGTAMFGPCFTATSTDVSLGQVSTPIIQQSNAMFVDTTDLSKTTMAASNAKFITASDETGTSLASGVVNSFDSQNIYLTVNVASGYTLVGNYLLI